MADIRFELKLITPGDEIARNILDRCAQELNRRFATGVMRNELKNLTRDWLEQAIVAQPEYDSLMWGKLQAELGLVDISKVQSIINIWLRGIDVVIIPVTVMGSQVFGNIAITAVPADFSDVLNSNAAKYVTDKGDEIPWLEWLLLQGDTIVVATHKVVSDPEKAKFSRTGTDIMLPTDGEGWRVPPEFSGTMDNNFVTRAIVSSLPGLRTLIEGQIRSRL